MSNFPKPYYFIIILMIVACFFGLGKMWCMDDSTNHTEQATLDSVCQGCEVFDSKRILTVVKSY